MSDFWREEGYNTIAEAEVERLRMALEKHHDLLSDEPGDYCKTCELDYLARPKE